MTANERSEMISRLRMAKDLREQMKIECELNSITMDEVTGSMAAAGIEVPGPKRKAGGHTPGAAEMDELRLIAATNADLREAAASGCTEECAANAAPEERACEPDPGDRSLMQCMTDAAAALKALRRCIGFGEVEVAVDSEKVSVAAILCGNLRFEVTSYGE